MGSPIPQHVYPILDFDHLLLGLSDILDCLILVTDDLLQFFELLLLDGNLGIDLLPLLLDPLRLSDLIGLPIEDVLSRIHLDATASHTGERIHLLLVFAGHAYGQLVRYELRSAA